MRNKKQILQFTLALFIIGLTSCEKELNITPIQEYTKQTNEYAKLIGDAKLGENAKFGENEPIEITLHFDDVIPKDKVMALLENFLQKENSNIYIREGINLDKIKFLQFSYDKKNDEFVQSSIKINDIGSLATSIENYLITIDNIEWNVANYQTERLIDRGPTTTLVVTTCCPWWTPLYY